MALDQTDYFQIFTWQCDARQFNQPISGTQGHIYKVSRCLNGRLVLSEIFQKY